MRPLKRRSRQSGFTLVEIAIVLVVIGLLLGGVLKGQEMITQARIKNVVNDFNGVTAAYYAYQDRYQAIPGDDSAAATRWASQNAVSGNGNSALEGTYNTAVQVPPVAETSMFWWDLRLAGFIPGPTTAVTGAVAQPNNAVGGIIGATTDSAATGTAGLSGVIVCTTHLLDKIAGAVDTQLDDQNPLTGTVHGQSEAGMPVLNGNPVLGNVWPPAGQSLNNPANTTYVETGSSNYIVCRQI